MKLVPKQPLETADISRGKLTWGVVLKTFIGAFLFFAIFYVLISALGLWLGSRMPDSWEAKVGPAFQVAGLGNILDKDDPQAAELETLQSIFDDLTEGETLRDLPYEISILESQVPNAFAAPGGRIYITTNLLDTVESRAGRALVIAHELGHHEQRDVFREMGRNSGARIFAALIGLGSLETTILSPADSSYSRVMETAADDFAVRLVLRKMGDAEGLFEFFEQMEAEEETEGRSRLLSYLETHPMSEDRLEKMQEIRAAWREAGGM